MKVLPGMLEIGDREREAMWAASAERDRERRRQELDAERYRWHAGQAERLRETMTDLITHHETQARQLLEKGSA